MFMDTGLLGRWGIRLDAPEETGPKSLTLAGLQVLTASPGKLFGKCAISADRLVARCNLDHGRVTIVADADLLAVDQLDGPTQHNLDAVLRVLAQLEPG
jgi:hypothetical protein